MSGVHGLTSAPGARFAVLLAPMRRALLLAALVSGFLVTVWLTASDPVRAQEEGETAPLTHQTASVAGAVHAPAAQAVANRPEATRAAHGHDGSGQDGSVPNGSGRNGSGQADAARTDTGRPDSGDRPDAAPADAGTSVPMAARINDPLVGAVSAVGENTTRMVFDGSAGVSRGNVPEAPEVARQIRDTVHGVTEPVEEYLDEDDASDAEPRAEDPSRAPADTDGRTGAESGAAVPSAPADTVTHFVPTAAEVSAGAVQRHADPDAENSPARLVSDPVATPSGLNGSSSGSAQGAPGGVPAVAGYLTTTGAPASAPGQLQAARHVLLAVPAESADEPTFSPD
ncbi:hypothetical protein [Nocardiopsis deserti]|uniref:hypothetical protein n=1 Tax=Nocardiopsis deserti TaxID=2605988 RepID=UPI001238A70A|nr:hypothetical protein [Nocardiopsis deserti]